MHIITFACMTVERDSQPPGPHNPVRNTFITLKNIIGQYFVYISKSNDSSNNSKKVVSIEGQMLKQEIYQESAHVRKWTFNMIHQGF